MVHNPKELIKKEEMTWNKTGKERMDRWIARITQTDSHLHRDV
jgi:hypothetical protein